jgi:hypothetical protein
LPSIDPRRRRGDRPAPSNANHRCKDCGAALLLIRQHTSPPRLGAPLTTEYYVCDACDAGYQFAPSTGTWKRCVVEEG